MNHISKAVFFDRDGVLNKLVWNPSTEAFESPHYPGDLIIVEDIEKPLKRLRHEGYKLFVISNQPSYAKGKTSLESIIKIAERFEHELKVRQITFEEVFYCLHHPEGIVPRFSYRCSCRKPEPYFLLQAKERYNIDLEASWMIGDRDSDIECGQRAGCKTILMINSHSANYQGKSYPDYIVEKLSEAVDYILANILEGSG